MVAKSPQLQNRFDLPGTLPSGRSQWFHLTRHDVERFMREGLIAEDATTELLNGVIVRKDRAARGEAVTTIGTDHQVAVELLSGLRSQINSAARHVRSQQPLVCREDHVPEPDFMVLRGTVRAYADSPTAADAYCVIEVADSSYGRDVGEKLAAYALAGVLQYVVINLVNRSAEVFTGPEPTGSYASTQTVATDEQILLRVGEDEVFALPLADVLP